ncbi:hypothetical protein POTOM_041265 [Populus tomentosa]|uniref:Uncharacterized protein n=1 Tax=Populus tomentosa TaxID=118781 RepID=A0A8X8CJ00_POPTO|nr:hypothetical protein POTOM_041265 [Populus tomentosa]
MNTLFTVLTLLIPIFLLLTKGRRSPKRVPPGSLGIPVVGHSLHLLHAMRANTAEKWPQQRIQKYGPISKLSLFGKPTVFIHGKDANKFVFTSDSSTLSSSLLESVKKLLGDRCLLELGGQDHKRVRDALGLFLKPESLKSYVGKMDEEVRMHIATHWEGKQEVKVLPFVWDRTRSYKRETCGLVSRNDRRDVIFWVIYMTHMDSSIFPESSKFDPARFKNQASIPPYCFIPFGGRPRICPGYEFARIETLITIHHLVTQFTWKLLADNFFKRDPMPVPAEGLPIQIMPKSTNRTS